MEDLRGRVAVVTGAASGIGRALSDRFVAEGMRVVLADVETAPLEAAVAELRAGGAEAVGVPTDVARREAVEALARDALAAFGAVHVLCNNAGVESGAPLAEIPPATWDWVMGVNLGGVLYGCQTFLPIMREQGEGHIVNTSSLAALMGGAPTVAPYAASKAAVLALSEVLHRELTAAGEPIGVSVLLPGPVATKMPDAERNRPPGVPALEEHPARVPIMAMLREMAETGLPPSRVADLVVEAIRNRRLYVVTHPQQTLEIAQARLDELRAAS